MAGSSGAGPIYELIEPTWERLKAPLRILLLGALPAWVVTVGALQTWLLPRATNPERAELAAVLVAPFAAWAAWRSYARGYYAVTVYSDRVELSRSDGCELVPTADVLALVGRGGINLDSGELIAWRRLVIVTWTSAHVLGFHREDNAELYRALRSVCPQARGLPFPFRLERPSPLGNGFSGTGPPNVAGLDALGRYYARHLLQTAALGLAIGGGCLAVLVSIVVNRGFGPDETNGAVVLIVGSVAGIFLLSAALRGARVLRAIRRAEVEG